MKISNLKINKKMLSLLLALNLGFVPTMGSVKADTYIVVGGKTMTDKVDIDNGFSFNLTKAKGRAMKLSSDKIHELFSKNSNITYSRNQYNKDFYTLNADGKVYTYYPDTNTLMCNSGMIKLEIYASNVKSLDDIDNTITVLGGSGSRRSGVKIDSANLYNNSIAIVVYPGNNDTNMSDVSDMIANSTRFINHVIGSDKEIYNSIVGTSEGAQASFVTAAQNKGLYKSLLCSNGAAYWTTSGINLIEKYAGNSGYKSFLNMEIIFFESKNNNNWNTYIIKTVNDLKSNGVPLSNICFYTNDRVLSNSFSGITREGGKYHAVTDREAWMYGGWSKHGDGMTMITESGVLSYLSSSEHIKYYLSKFENNAIKSRK